jgi:enoyl-CoA hydratase
MHGNQDMPWDPTLDYAMMSRNTEDFMSLWRARVPTICRMHGAAAAGGSDIALCCDMVVMAEDARIGYPPARVWGIPTPMMWVYRLGIENAKRMLFTGDLITGGGRGDGADPAGRARGGAGSSGRGTVRAHQGRAAQPADDEQAGREPGLRGHGAREHAALRQFLRRHGAPFSGGLWFRQRAVRMSGSSQAVAERDSGAPIAAGASKTLPPLARGAVDAARDTGGEGS